MLRIISDVTHIQLPKNNPQYMHTTLDLTNKIIIFPVALIKTFLINTAYQPMAEQVKNNFKYIHHFIFDLFLNFIIVYLYNHAKNLVLHFLLYSILHGK